MSKELSKKELVAKIVDANADAFQAGKIDRKGVIALIATEAKMTDAGASTYFYNATKDMASYKKAAKAAKPADPIVAEIKAKAEEPKAEAAKPAKAKAKVKVEVEAPKAEAKPEPVTARGSWDEWKVVNAQARAEIDAKLASIDFSEVVPAFLQKGR